MRHGMESEGTMIRIRHFTEQDAPVIGRNQYPGVPMAEIREMISEWENNTCRGRYFEMFAVTRDGAVVGSVSLFEHTKSAVSVGVEIYPGERRKGYAFTGMRLVMEHARALHYRVILDQVRPDNPASVALHKRLGFETDGYIYKNAKGQDVLLFLLCL